MVVISENLLIVRREIGVKKESRRRGSLKGIIGRTIGTCTVCVILERVAGKEDGCFDSRVYGLVEWKSEGR